MYIHIYVVGKRIASDPNRRPDAQKGDACEMYSLRDLATITIYSIEYIDSAHAEHLKYNNCTFKSLPQHADERV
jgi:hypothetical protein